MTLARTIAELTSALGLGRMPAGDLGAKIQSFGGGPSMQHAA